MPTDGLQAMVNLTGLTKEDMKRMWDQARVNVDRLSSCSNHGFVQIPGTPDHRRRYRCMHCLGEVDASSYRWYMCGRQHAIDQLLDAGYRPPL